MHRHRWLLHSQWASAVPKYFYTLDLTHFMAHCPPPKNTPKLSPSPAQPSHQSPFLKRGFPGLTGSWEVASWPGADTQQHRGWREGVVPSLHPRESLRKTQCSSLMKCPLRTMSCRLSASSRPTLQWGGAPSATARPTVPMRPPTGPRPRPPKDTQPGSYGKGPRCAGVGHRGRPHMQQSWESHMEQRQAASPPAMGRRRPNPNWPPPHLVHTHRVSPLPGEPPTW